MAITAKDLKGTVVRKQLDAFCRVKGYTPKQKGDLTKKFLANFNKVFSTTFQLDMGISSCFVWVSTPEGHHFWLEIDTI